MNMNQHETYPEITIPELEQCLINNLYGNLYNPTYPLAQPMIWLGSPGTAKTHYAVYRVPVVIADFLSATTGEEVTPEQIGVVVIHAGIRDPQEMSGPACPSPDQDGIMVFRFTKPPTKSEMDDIRRDNDIKAFIVVCDEIASARDDQQLACQRLFDESPKLGDVDMSYDDCPVFTIGTGNRMQDKAASRRLLTSISDRCEIYTMKFSFRAWKRWALDNGVCPVIIDFMEQHWQQVIATAVPKFDGPYGTPRSMTQVAAKLDGYMRRPEVFDGSIPGWLEIQFSSLIGAKAARLLTDWIESRNEVPLVADVFSNPRAALLSDNFGYQSIAGHMVLNAVTTGHEVEQAVLYIRRMRRDLQIVMGMKLQDILNAPDFDDSISSPVIQDFNDEFGQYFSLAA